MIWLARPIRCFRLRSENLVELKARSISYEGTAGRARARRPQASLIEADITSVRRPTNPGALSVA